MNEQNEPAHRGQLRAARAPKPPFFLLKNRRAVDRVRAPASLKNICATVETERATCEQVTDLFQRRLGHWLRSRTPGVSHDEHRVPPEYALQKIDPAGHYRLAAAANESPNDYAVSLFRYSPQQARSSQIDALPNGGF